MSDQTGKRTDLISSPVQIIMGHPLSSCTSLAPGHRHCIVLSLIGNWVIGKMIITYLIALKMTFAQFF